MKESLWKKAHERKIVKERLWKGYWKTDWDWTIERLKEKNCRFAESNFSLFSPIFSETNKNELPTDQRINGWTDGQTYPPVTHKLSDHTITVPKYSEGGVFKPLPFLYVKSDPFKNGTKRFSLENRFHWWSHKSNWMKNKQFIAVMVLQVFHFVTDRCLSKIQNLQRIWKNWKMKNVRFL